MSRLFGTSPTACESESRESDARISSMSETHQPEFLRLTVLLRHLRDADCRPAFLVPQGRRHDESSMGCFWRLLAHPNWREGPFYFVSLVVVKQSLHNVPMSTKRTGAAPEPQWSPQNRPRVVRAKPAKGKRPGTQLFYPAACCGGKSIFVRQLRGPHLSP
jgi:hypothetical protein